MTTLDFQVRKDDLVWGRIPVWGFGTAVQSLPPGVAVGEQLYGYFPMASHVVLSPTRPTEAGFMDSAPRTVARGLQPGTTLHS
jgi:hypothetical protein